MTMDIDEARLKKKKTKKKTVIQFNSISIQFIHTYSHELRSFTTMVKKKKKKKNKGKVATCAPGITLK